MSGSRLAAMATAILWGFTYLLTTDMLPHHPALVAAVRALGGAAFLLAIGWELPPRDWLGRLFILGTLNTGVFFGLFFIGVMRLPGGVAAIFQALGPIAVLLLAWGILRKTPSAMQFLSVAMGVVGVTLVVLRAGVRIDGIGVAAALASTVSLSLGGVLMNRWGKAPIGFAAFTGWQLLVGGVELALVTLLIGDFGGGITVTNVVAFAILAVLLTGIPFLLWFKAISRIGAVNVMPFILLTPVTALVLDAVFKGLIPTAIQLLGVAIVMAALVVNYLASRAAQK
ncbi:DMT family transporter [Paenirhodobacter populi]|uniref:Permease n=1 Tax=Paenirhodobacter populi TaxID=2306993 RepID=A0A443KBC8_9RHOB|nr:DMT family transporter [Sinirhodobacter populi]RWR08806.1 permease [Sinirhodobacter populi]RWR30068.1 permease [Sinirhodobacter populi]